VHVGLSLGIVAVMTLAFINAQAYVYHAMEMPIADSAYPGMFYAITGTMLALVIIGWSSRRHRVPACSAVARRPRARLRARHVLVLRRRRLLGRLVPRVRDEVS
jgi:hypothetical protein